MLCVSLGKVEKPCHGVDSTMVGFVLLWPLCFIYPLISKGMSICKFLHLGNSNTSHFYGDDVPTSAQYKVGGWVKWKHKMWSLTMLSRGQLPICPFGCWSIYKFLLLNFHIMTKNGIFILFKLNGPTKRYFNFKSDSLESR